MNTLPHSLLLADDDPDDRLFFKDALQETGMPAMLDTVNDGVELMQYLNDSSDKLPDILFLDLNMPRKSGLECLKEIKQNKSFEFLPIIIFSTSCDKRITEDLYEYGAHFCIRKPGDFNKLQDIIKKAISLTKGMDRPAKENFILA